MLCEKCQFRDALVHLCSSRQLDVKTIEFYQHHYCPKCAEDLHVKELGIPPRTATNNELKEEMRVVAEGSDSVVVEVIRINNLPCEPERRLALKDWLPPQLRKIGTELAVVSTPGDVKWFYAPNKNEAEGSVLEK